MDTQKEITLLIADDSEFNKELIKAAFYIDESLQIIEANDGKEAIDKFERYNPDIVILDIMMPYLNGVDTLRIMRDINKNIPIIILTAVDDSKMKKRCMELGASSYLTKPVTENKLTQLFNELLKR